MRTSDDPSLQWKNLNIEWIALQGLKDALRHCQSIEVTPTAPEHAADAHAVEKILTALLVDD